MPGEKKGGGEVYNPLSKNQQKKDNKPTYDNDDLGNIKDDYRRPDYRAPPRDYY